MENSLKKGLARDMYFVVTQLLALGEKELTAEIVRNELAKVYQLMHGSTAWLRVHDKGPASRQSPVTRVRRTTSSSRINAAQ